MKTLKQQVINWLREHTKREDWFNVNTRFFDREYCMAQDECCRSARTFQREAGEHDAKVYVRVTDNEFNTDAIHFEDVFCEIDQPTFIADAIYELRHVTLNYDCGQFHYDVSLNRFVNIRNSHIYVPASKVGPNKIYTAFLVTKEGFIAKHTDEVPPNGMDSTGDPDSAAEWYIGGKKMNPIGVWKDVELTDDGLTATGELFEPVTAVQLLQVAASNIGDRASERDTESERSMACAVKAFNAMYSKDLTEEEGWMFQVFLKASRAKGGDFRDDDYVDGASYFGLAGECASVERRKK